MATKLKNLEVTKVDLVDVGANQKADILLYKNKSGTSGGSEKDEEEPGLFKSIVSSIGKLLGIQQEQIDTVIKREAETFEERMYEVKQGKICDEIWEICYALQSSLVSTVRDDDKKSKEKRTMMEESLNDFMEVMKNSIAGWASGEETNLSKSDKTMSQAEIEHFSKVRDDLNNILKSCNKEEGNPLPESAENNESEKGDYAEMKIDKSKLTAVEKAFYEDIEKRCGVEEEQGANQEGQPDAVTKSGGVKSEEHQESEKPMETDPDDIYKGMHPEVAKEIQELRKRANEAEEKELQEVAKKYEVIGKKTEDLVPVLKELRATGGNAYEGMIALMDASVEMVEKAGVFSEIGKRGTDSVPQSDSVLKAKMAEIKKSQSGLTDAQAMDAVFLENPELLGEYDK